MKWYTKSKVDDVQGLIIDEETGKTIAVCYDAKHAQLIALAPKLLEVLKKSEMRIDQLCDLVNMVKKDLSEYVNYPDPLVKAAEWTKGISDVIAEVEYIS
jgi:hypothetical protein